MTVNGWKVPPVLPTVGEFESYHKERVAEVEAIGKRQMVSRVSAEIQGGEAGIKAKKVGNSAEIPRPERPMVGVRKLLEGLPGEVGVLELVVGRSVSIAEVDAAYQVVVDGAVRLPSNSACWRCLSGRECDGERSGFYHFQKGDANILYNRIHLVTPTVVVFSLLWGGGQLGGGAGSPEEHARLTDWLRSTGGPICGRRLPCNVVLCQGSAVGVEPTVQGSCRTKARS